MPNSLLDTLYNEGIAKGIAIGRTEAEEQNKPKWQAEGIAIGRAEAEEQNKPKWQAEGMILSILSVIKARFGSVPNSLQDKLFTITDIERLETITQQAVTCASLKEFSEII